MMRAQYRLGQGIPALWHQADQSAFWGPDEVASQDAMALYRASEHDLTPGPDAASAAAAEAWAQWARTVEQYGTSAYQTPGVQYSSPAGPPAPSKSLLSDPRILGVLLFIGVLLIIPGPGGRR